MMLEQERAERQLHQQQVLDEELHSRQEKQKQKNELIDDLVNNAYQRVSNSACLSSFASTLSL